MDLSKKINKDNLHHAYLIEGEGSFVTPHLFNVIESIGIKTGANSNIFHKKYVSFLFHSVNIVIISIIEKL